MAEANRDQNRVTTLLATSNADGITPVKLYADPITHRLLVDSTGSAGTPGGPNMSVQFNDGGTFGGESDFTWNKTTDTLDFASGAIIKSSSGTNYFANVSTILGSAVGNSALGSITFGVGNAPSIKGDSTTHTVHFVDDISSFSAAMLMSSLTADRTYTWPNKDGTIAMLSDITTSSTDYTTSFMFMGA